MRGRRRESGRRMRGKGCMRGVKRGMSGTEGNGADGEEERWRDGREGGCAGEEKEGVGGKREGGYIEEGVGGGFIGRK